MHLGTEGETPYRSLKKSFTHCLAQGVQVEEVPVVPGDFRGGRGWEGGGEGWERGWERKGRSVKREDRGAYQTSKIIHSFTNANNNHVSFPFVHSLLPYRP